MRAAVIAIILSLALAGCTSATDEDGSGTESPPYDSDTESPSWAVATHNFSVTSQGNPVNVVATTYTVTNNPSAILAVHGSVGFRDNNWGELPVAGYCLGCRAAASQWDFYAIDLPGYGDSDDAGPEETIDDWAMVVDQIAIQLRQQGYSDVVGLGHSMGGLIVDVAQGRHDSFDGIITTGWAHSGFNEEIFTCQVDDSCLDRQDLYYEMSNADPLVVEYMLEQVGSRPGDVDGNLAYGQRASPDGPSPQDAHLNLIIVPVLVMVGDSDHYWKSDELLEEWRYYPNAASVDVVLVDQAGHFLFHHLNHESTQRKLLDWLERTDFN